MPPDRPANPSPCLITRLPVIRLPLAVTDYASAVEWLKSAAMAGDRAYAVSAANTHLTTLSRHDPVFEAIMARFDINFPDGMPLIWAMNRQMPANERMKDRVYGPTLMLETLKATAGDPHYSHFLLGGQESTLEKLTSNLPVRIPDCSIAGAYSPPFGTWSDQENQKIFSLIKESRANFVWVGLGCPKQETWIATHKDHLPPAVYLGIGAAFAFHAGEVSQAPPWMQDCGLEWLFRLGAEPRRLFKRYFIYNSLFMWYYLKG